MRGTVVVASVETLESLVDGAVAEPGGNEVGRVLTSWLYTHTCNDISCGMDDIFGNSEGMQSMQRVQAFLHTQCGPCHRGFKYYC